MSDWKSVRLEVCKIGIGSVGLEECKIGSEVVLQTFAHTAFSNMQTQKKKDLNVFLTLLLRGGTPPAVFCVLP